jgi:hypothetical protein
MIPLENPVSRPPVSSRQYTFFAEDPSMSSFEFFKPPGITNLSNRENSRFQSTNAGDLQGLQRTEGKRQSSWPENSWRIKSCQNKTALRLIDIKTDQETTHQSSHRISNATIASNPEFENFKKFLSARSQEDNHQKENLTETKILSYSLAKSPNLNSSSSEFENNLLIRCDPISPFLEAIFGNMNENERLNKCPRNPFADQTEISKAMRQVVFNWLIGGIRTFGLKLRTIFLTCNILDRYISCRQLRRENFQLAGTACLFLCSKFEDMNPLTLEQVGTLLDEYHTLTDILSTEGDILLALNFDMHTHLVIDVFEILVKISGEKKESVIKMGSEVLICFTCHHHIDKFNTFKLASFALEFSTKHFCESPDAVCFHGRLSPDEFAFYEGKLRRILTKLKNQDLNEIGLVNSFVNTQLFG